jgi:hypothetical protein
MKEVFRKLFGREPMSAEDREAFALCAVAIVFGWLGFGLAVLFA